MENQITGVVTQSKAAGVEHRPGVDNPSVTRGFDKATCASSGSKPNSLSREALHQQPGEDIVIVTRGEDVDTCASSGSRASRLRHEPLQHDNTCVSTVPRGGENAKCRSVQLRSRRHSREVLRRRAAAEYRAEEELVKLNEQLMREKEKQMKNMEQLMREKEQQMKKKEQLIKKKLALEIAEIEEEEQEHCAPRQNYDLPVFDGSPVDWMAYRRAYEATASMYSTFENTMRLQASLRGAAKYAVKGLLRTGSDPTDVIEALEEEFGHPYLLLDTALNKIRSLPLVSDSGVELRNMTRVVRNCVYMLRNIKADGYINNPQLVHEILGKLTHVQRAQYGEFVMMRNIDSNEDLRVSPNINMLLDFLSHLTRASAYYLPLNMDTEQSN